MKTKLIITGVGILLVVLGVLIGVSISKQSEINPIEKAQNKNVTLSYASPENNALVKVVRVVDGDTIEIEGGERVRYIGMDTPETVDPRKPVQCFGAEASKKNKELVEGKMVRLEKDVTDRDKYQRLLRYVWLGDEMINKALVEGGFAHSYTYPPDVKYQAEFVKAEKVARDAKIGLWNSCPTASNSLSKTGTPAIDVQADRGSCDIKGNISLSGDKIYHMVGCGSYAKTSIDETKGEKWFCSEGEAQSAGWRKAQNCS